jgi:hypothetical protein
MKYETLGEFIGEISDYLDQEYIDSLGKDKDLSEQEKLTIRNIVFEHFESGDNPPNAANLIIEYLKRK